MKVRPILISMLLVCPVAFARQQTAVRPAAAQAPARGYEAEFLADLDDLQDKILDLAKAVPPDRYGWRPAAGVRSISEVYMHIAGGNYFLATFVGAKPPSDIPDDMEKITDKQRIVSELQKSFAWTRNLVKTTPEADLDKPVTMLGKTTTYRGVFTTILNHMHEHLGQSIAYARMNGVVPPWSR